MAERGQPGRDVRFERAETGARAGRRHRGTARARVLQVLGDSWAPDW